MRFIHFLRVYYVLKIIILFLGYIGSRYLCSIFFCKTTDYVHKFHIFFSPAPTFSDSYNKPNERLEDSKVLSSISFFFINNCLWRSSKFIPTLDEFGLLLIILRNKKLREIRNINNYQHHKQCNIIYIRYRARAFNKLKLKCMMIV